MQRTPVRFRDRRLVAAALLAIVATSAACSDDDNGNNNTGLPASTTYAGYVSSTTGGFGPLNITFASAVKAPPIQTMGSTGPSFSSGAPVNATGTVSINGGAPVDLTGTVDGGTLHLEGGGWVLDGTLQNGMITGTFTGPGPISGSLSALSYAAGDPAQMYCGWYEGTDLTNSGSVYGSFSMVISGTVLLGTAVDEANEDPIDFAGTAKPSTGELSIDMSDGSGGRLVVDGTYDELGASGTFDTYLGTTHIQTGDFGSYLGCEPL